MFALLNRVSWFLSFSLGFVITFLLGIVTGILDYVEFESDLFLMWIGFSSLFGFLLKKILFSKKSLQNALSEIQHQHHSQEYLKKSNTKNIPEKSIPAQKSAHDVSHGHHNVPPEAKNHIPSPSVQRAKTPKGPNIFQKFFAENALAKVGGILLFLGVLFLLQLVYTHIGPVGKVIIGFGIGAVIYLTGVFLAKKGFVKESHSLLGTGIVITYLVILAGRYLITGNIGSDGFFSEGITLFLLFCNTALAIATSLVYTSQILLFFSFFFAYSIPLLVPDAFPSATPYLLGGYALLLSFGALALHVFLKKTPSFRIHTLFVFAALGGNSLLLMTPFSGGRIGEVFVLLSQTLLNAGILLSVFRSSHKKYLLYYLLLAYASLSLLMFNSIPYGGFPVGSFLLYGLALFGLLAGNIFALVYIPVVSLFGLLFAPLCLLAFFIGIHGVPISALGILLVVTTLFYGFAFTALHKAIPPLFQYIFFGILGGFFLYISALLRDSYEFFIYHGEVGIHGYVNETFVTTQALAIVVSAFVFLGLAYVFSQKKSLSHLYPIGTIGCISIIAPIIDRSGDLMTLSVFSIICVVLASMILPLFRSSFAATSVQSTLIGLLSGVLFGAGNIFYFGEKFFPGVATGVAFLGFAALYCGMSVILFSRLRKNVSDVGKIEKGQGGAEKHALKNMIFSLLGISLSLFSLAIAFVFSQHGEIVSLVWLFEATVLLFLYKKFSDIKIYIAAMILLAIGLGKLALLVAVIGSGDFVSLIPLSVICASLFTNLFFLQEERNHIRILHDVGHLLAIGIVGILLLIIIPSHHHGWSLLGISAASILLACMYTRMYTGSVRPVFTLVFLLMLFIHNVSLESIFKAVEFENIAYLKILQYIATGLFSFAFLLQRQKYQKTALHLTLLTLFPVYLFGITTQYVYDIFRENIFFITIYWCVLAFLLCGYGIQKNIPRFRTIGLYILILTVAKILLYDVWYGIDDAVTRIIALMLTGALMITISLFYTKKYGDTLTGELALKNLMQKNLP